MRPRHIFFCLLLLESTVSAQPITSRTDQVGQWLNQWTEEKTAAGHEGDSYDNRDRGHSMLDASMYPGLKHLTYSAAEKEKNQDHGPAGRVFLEGPVLGNASMSAGVEQGGSLPRMYYSGENGLRFLTTQYFSNNIYFYPEHLDHDPAPAGFGDLYPTNTPFVVISQGSSGTDQPFIKAFAAGLAAFSPELKRDLVKAKLLGPTLQALFRQTSHLVKKPGDYFTGAAHPPVFDSSAIDEERFVKACHDLTPQTTPPIVVLTDLKRDEPKAAVDFFEAPGVDNERLGGIGPLSASIFRGKEYARHMKFSATTSKDVQGKSLRFRWVLLRGDAKRVTILPSETTNEAEITVQWHPRRPVSPGSDLESSRVDIGVFAENEAGAVSAPGFITWWFPPNEDRAYTADGKLLAIDYDSVAQSNGMPPRDSKRAWHLLELVDAGGRPASGKLFDLDDKNSAELRALLKEKSAGRLEIKQLEKEADTLEKTGKEALAKAQTAVQNLEKEKADAITLTSARAELATVQAANSLSNNNVAKLRESIEAKAKEITQSIPDPLWAAVLASVEKVTAQPEFYFQHAAAIKKAVEQTADKTAGPLLEAELRRLGERGVIEEENGINLPKSHDAASAEADAHCLRQFNRFILSLAFFPDVFDAKPARLYTDPRLTVRKPWRDVMLPRGGWVRWQAGKATRYDSEGRLVLESDAKGNPGKVAPVRYELTEDRTSLKIVE